jgi:hypothetical protein
MTNKDKIEMKISKHLLLTSKEASRQRALQLFPAAHAMLARKKDNGRAEAALMAMVPIANFDRKQRRFEDTQERN